MGDRAIAEAITEEEGRALSCISLTRSWQGIGTEMMASLIRRGLVKDDGNTLLLSSEAEDAVSLYPLLGREGKAETYPGSFHEMLLSGSGQIKEMEEAAAICFPSLDKAGTARLVQSAKDAFDRLGLFRSFERAEAYLSLPLSSRIAYILSPSDSIRRAKAAAAVQLSAFISGISSDEEKSAEDLIRQASGFDELSFFDLESQQVLYRKEGRLYGRREGNERESLVVSSDFTVIAGGRHRIPIQAIAEPRRSGPVSEWMITKQSIRKALLCGLAGRKIIDILAEASDETIPESVKSRILFWEETLSSVRGEDAVVLTVSERAGRLMNAMREQLEEHIIANPVPSLFIMRPESADIWTRLLADVDLDVLGKISGKPAPEHEQDIPIEEIRVPRMLPQSRAVPFNAEKRLRLLSTEDQYRRALVLSGLIYSDDQETPPLEDAILGLDYQEKRRAISHALSHGEKIYAEFVGGSVLIDRPEKSEREGCVRLGGRDIDIAKIWKTAILPISIASLTYLCPSDNDSL